MDSLDILNPDNLDLNDFVYSIVLPEIKKIFKENLNISRLEPIEEYINSPEVINNIKINKDEDIIINIEKLLLYAISNLSVLRISEDYKIELDPNIFVPRTTAKFIDIVSLVEYGSLGSPAYPIVKDTFEIVASNLEPLYTNYVEGL